MRLWVRVFTVVNVFLYQLTRGILGSNMGGQSMLLLYTTGRKSGKTHVIPISYFRDGENYILVASNWGRSFHPDWYHNLLSKPEAEIQVKWHKLLACAHPASAEEYDRLWNYVIRRNAIYMHYQRHTRRKIPVVILEPISQVLADGFAEQPRSSAQR